MVPGSLETWETPHRSLYMAVLGDSVSFGDSVLPPKAQAWYVPLQTAACSWR